VVSAVCQVKRDKVGTTDHDLRLLNWAQHRPLVIAFDGWNVKSPKLASQPYSRGKKVGGPRKQGVDLPGGGGNWSNRKRSSG